MTSVPLATATGSVPLARSAGTRQLNASLTSQTASPTLELEQLLAQGWPDVSVLAYTLASISMLPPDLNAAENRVAVRAVLQQALEQENHKPLNTQARNQAYVLALAYYHVLVAEPAALSDPTQISIASQYGLARGVQLYGSLTLSDSTHFQNMVSLMQPSHPSNFVVVNTPVAPLASSPVPDQAIEVAPIEAVETLSEDQIDSLLGNFISSRATALVKEKSTLVEKVYGASRYEVLKGKSISASLVAVRGELRVYFTIPDAANATGQTFYQALERGQQYHERQGNSAEAAKYKARGQATVSAEAAGLSEQDYARLLTYVQSKKNGLNLSHGAAVK